MTDDKATADSERPHAVGAPVERPVRRLWCWWFGCSPDYEALRHDWHAVPCERCGAPDTSYECRIGDSRHARMVDRLRRLRWRLFDSWRPQPCAACGKRGKCADDCDGIPF